MKSSITGLFCFALTVLVATHASAQMNNRPFSFSGGGSGLGMSKAGQQAILLQKLEGRTPDNIIRGANGLITIERRRGRPGWRDDPSVPWPQHGDHRRRWHLQSVLPRWLAAKLWVHQLGESPHKQRDFRLDQHGERRRISRWRFDRRLDQYGWRLSMP